VPGDVLGVGGFEFGDTSPKSPPRPIFFVEADPIACWPRK